MLAAVRDIYRQSKKKRDNFWTEWISRPPAALLVWMLKETSVTPNQVSFLAIGVAAGGCATLIFWRTWLGLVVAGLLLQLAYVIDCVDGQLARLKSLASPVGALLDFMLDEVKAFMVIASAAARLYLQTPSATDGARWLLIGLGGLFAAAVGITLTTFMRRPEYLDAIGAPPLPPATERGGHFDKLAPKSLSPVALVEALGRYVLHYPSWFLFVCAFNRLDIFLYAYLGAHVLYLGRASLTILLKLGRGR
ncbi:MAG TPA: CDP-alcohol phosphatidyltransferase family protein [Polyangia bacterium]|nr:CDP-alcohol phosphatidyltransferase family protein [Polyangia bacterium]